MCLKYTRGRSALFARLRGFRPWRNLKNDSLVLPWKFEKYRNASRAMPPGKFDTFQPTVGHHVFHLDPNGDAYLRLKVASVQSHRKQGADR